MLLEPGLRVGCVQSCCQKPGTLFLHQRQLRSVTAPRDPPFPVHRSNRSQVDSGT